jgi:hypothetical protein
MFKNKMLKHATRATTVLFIIYYGFRLFNSFFSNFLYKMEIYKLIEPEIEKNLHNINNEQIQSNSQ